MTILLRAAACHVSPIFLSAKATTEKCISLIHQAARNKAKLVVFPESYIPAFPVWSALRPPTENHDLFKTMVQESIYADGKEIHAIRQAAKETGTIVSVGISEKVRYSSATLFNSNLIFDHTGDLAIHHRKLMPTFFEKLTWSPGDGHGLRVLETGYGKIGNLICGENTNPLARYALMAQGEQIHISTWPASWPTRALSGDTVQDSEKTSEGEQAGKPSQAKNYDNVAANRMRAAAHCFEAKCFGILCSGFLDNKALEMVVAGSGSPESVRSTLERSSRGATMYLDPMGALLPGFVIDSKGAEIPKDYLQDEERILYADIDVGECVEGKQYHDVVGGYQRLDVFDLKVNRTRREPAIFVDDGFDTKAE